MSFLQFNPRSLRVLKWASPATTSRRKKDIFQHRVSLINEKEEDKAQRVGSAMIVRGQELSYWARDRCQGLPSGRCFPSPAELDCCWVSLSMTMHCLSVRPHQQRSIKLFIRSQTSQAEKDCRIEVPEPEKGSSQDFRPASDTSDHSSDPRLQGQLFIKSRVHRARHFTTIDLLLWPSTY